DRQEVVTHLVGRISEVARAGRHPELTIASSPPTLQHVVVEDRARCTAARGDALRGASRPEIHIGERIAHLVGIIASRLVRAETERTARSLAPTLHLVVVEEHARMLVAGRDRLGGASCPEIDVGKSIAHLAWLRAVGLVVAETERAFEVTAPALDPAVVE